MTRRDLKEKRLASARRKALTGEPLTFLETKEVFKEGVKYSAKVLKEYQETKEPGPKARHYVAGGIIGAMIGFNRGLNKKYK